MFSSEALFVISVAARLVELHPTTLRKYERAGFLEPSRTGGNIRLYSPEDIARLKQIKFLVDEQGVNLAGIEIALTLTRRLRTLRTVLAHGREGKEGNREAIRLVDELLSVLGAA